MTNKKEQILKEKKNKKRTFEENTSLGRIQDRITELEIKIEEIENSK